jgi:DNA-binding CsgD family transcriptional regulator
VALDELHAIINKNLPLSVLCAVRLPINDPDWKPVPDKSLFMHKDAPEGWWEEYDAHARGKFRPVLFLTRSGLASLTWTEMLHLFQPIGVDRWAFDLALKYGMRDGLICPLGGRWVVVFWSRRALSNVLTQPDRIMIFAAASFAALRLEQLTGPDAARIGSHARLTARELAVLRLVSTGAQTDGIAQALGLGEETVRSHLKKAQVKLGVRSRAHAACDAVRLNLIP